MGLKVFYFFKEKLLNFKLDLSQAIPFLTTQNKIKVSKTEIITQRAGREPFRKLLVQSID